MKRLQTLTPIPTAIIIRVNGVQNFIHISGMFPNIFQDIGGGIDGCHIQHIIS